MKTRITSGTIKFKGKNIPVLQRELTTAGNFAVARDGRKFFSDRKAGYVEVKEHSAHD